MPSKQLLWVSFIIRCYFPKCYLIILQNASFWCSIVLLECGHKNSFLKWSCLRKYACFPNMWTRAVCVRPFLAFKTSTERIWKNIQYFSVMTYLTIFYYCFFFFHAYIHFWNSNYFYCYYKEENACKFSIFFFSEFFLGWQVKSLFVYLRLYNYSIFSFIHFLMLHIQVFFFFLLQLEQGVKFSAQIFREVTL